jgi:phage shock protein E
MCVLFPRLLVLPSMTPHWVLGDSMRPWFGGMDPAGCVFDAGGPSVTRLQALENPYGPNRRQVVLQRWMVVLVMGATLLGACSSAPAAEVEPSTGTDTVVAAGGGGLVDEVASRVLLDVRTPAEHAEGHLAGSLNIDVNDPGFAAAVGALPRNDRYLVYCRSGNRSAQAIAIMAEMGFTDLVDGGGYADLVAAGAR